MWLSQGLKADLTVNYLQQVMFAQELQLMLLWLSINMIILSIKLLILVDKIVENCKKRFPKVQGEVIKVPLQFN